MEYRTLGRSDVKVSSIALGCMSLCANPTYPEIPESQATATVHAALDAGINFFDNAPAYGDGEAERRLGNALKGNRRDKAVVATKISSNTLAADEVARECEASLSRLQMDHVELYQVHWPKRVVPIDETIGAMEKLQRDGKVGAVGVCNFGPLDLAELLETRRVATNQMVYSLLARGIEFEVRDVCAERGIGLLCYSPLAQGLLTGRYASADDVPPERARTRHFATTRPQARHGESGCETETFTAIREIKRICDRIGHPMADVAVAWLLHQPGVTSVLAGASRPDQIVQSARAGSLKLSKDVLDELDVATRQVKQKMGANPDMWQGKAGSRVR